MVEEVVAAKVIEINDAKKLLKERAQADTQLRGVLVLEYRSDGTQMYYSSTMSQEEKCFMKCFFDAVTNRWFDQLRDNSR